MRIFLRIFPLVCIVLTAAAGCAVNDTCGRVSIINRSDKDVSTIKIGDRVLALHVFAGTEAEYWYIMGVRGTLLIEGLDKVYAQKGIKEVEDPEVTLSLGYHYIITIQQDSGDNSNEYTAEITRNIQGDIADDTSVPSDWISD